MISHHPIKFGDHTYCASKHEMFIVAEEVDWR